VHVSAKADYAVRALLMLADRSPDLVKIDVLSTEQDLPRGFAEGILNDLRKLGFVASRRGAHGGYTLARPADKITVGGVLRLVDGPFVTVRAAPPDQLTYRGVAQHLPAVWGAMDDSLHGVLDEMTLDDLLHGRVGSVDQGDQFSI
jgi:Rrf2 family protein